MYGVKKKFYKMIKFLQVMSNSEDRKIYLSSKLKLKNFIYYSLIINSVLSFTILTFINDSYIDLLFNRYFSRIAGKLTEIKIPKFLREEIYNYYIKFYKINKDDILNSELANYETFKDFYIREINVFSCYF